MISKLENKNGDVASLIFTVFQNSYKVEAQLIEVCDFPPLTRSTRDIQCSETLFYGFFEQECLVGVIELVTKDELLEINSLTVEPNHFKKGIAGKLLSYALKEFIFSEAIVETAIANEPAINLYKKHGFVEFKRWTPSHGIPKLAMTVKRLSNH